MSVGLQELSYLKPVAGIRLSTAAANICYKDREDVVVIECCEGTSCAGVFTQNAFCAAPVIIARKHMSDAEPRAFIINSGNANAGTGNQGLQDAQQCCELVATELGCDAAQVLPFSTGVIGQNLPVDRIQAVIPLVASQLNDDAWNQAAQAIMTTDTMAKGKSLSLNLGGKDIAITGIAKGSGMIRPDMATLLSFIATDAAIDDELLQACLNSAVEKSFNRITVDGDTSTNDSCMLLATGRSGVNIQQGSEDYLQFEQAITEVCIYLAQSMIRDGEGATKFISVIVEQGKDCRECLDVAYTIAHSPLVKTAFFASDPNWGRILAAVGRSGLQGMVLEDISIYLDDTCIVENGGVAGSYTEAQGQAVMDKEEITIRVVLGRGQENECVWTTDLSYDYVKINAEYRT